MNHQHWWIAAFDQSLGIAKNGLIPWYCKEDLQWFRQVTSNPRTLQKIYMVMGAQTWRTLGSQPLKGDRHHLVFTRNPPSSHHPKVQFLQPESFPLFLQKQNQPSIFYWIGGTQCWNWMLQFIDQSIFHLHGGFATYFDSNFQCDLQLPPKMLQNLAPKIIHRPKSPILVQFDEKVKEIPMEIVEWQKYPSQEEKQYLQTIQNILLKGTSKKDRTNIGTWNLFGHMMRYSLTNGRIPLLTTKKVFLKGIIEELGWFLRGETDSKILHEKGVHIWDGNSSRSFLDHSGFPDREEGDCGPIYGFQMRHFGAEYKDCHTNYQGQGVDQIAYVIDQIKNHPTSRRIVMNLWNTKDLSQMVLPPCHVLYQFQVEGDELSCALYQRSGDMGLGVPFNIASAAILTHWIAYQTGKKAKELVHFIGDGHIYQNHRVGLEEQLRREERSFPRLEIVPPTDGRTKWNVEDLSMKCFQLHGYYPHSTIKMDMAI